MCISSLHFIFVQIISIDAVSQGTLESPRYPLVRKLGNTVQNVNKRKRLAASLAFPVQGGGFKNVFLLEKTIPLNLVEPKLLLLLLQTMQNQNTRF